MNKILSIVCAVSLVGGVAFAGVSAGDNPSQKRIKKTINIQSEAITITYGGSGTNSVGSAKIWDFEEGVVSIVGVVVDDLVCSVTATNGFADTDDGDFGLGTTAIAAASTLATATEVNLCPKTAFDNIGSTTNDAHLAASAIIDGSATASDMYFNMLVDSNAITGNATATISARVHIIYDVIGDN